MNISSVDQALPPMTLRQKAIVLIVATVVLFVFFRQQFLSHFSLLSSDRYDGVIQVALLEHWFNVARGFSHWASPNYFFPYEKVLGYNEGLFLYGLIYSVFRFFSIDPFLSGELVNIVIKAIGFGGFFVAARKIFKLQFSWSLLGAAVFALSNNSYVQVDHAQLLSVSFAPVEAVLIYSSWNALILSRRWRFFCLGSLTAIFFSAWLLTCLYTAWFFALFLFMIACILAFRGGKQGLDKLKHALSENWWGVLGIAAIAAGSLMPFCSVYLTGQQVVRHRPWSEILFYGPSLLDSINVGANNLLFGDMLGWARERCSICDLGTGEREAGIAPILFLLAGLGVAEIFRRRMSMPAQKVAVIYGVAIASVVLWLLSIRFGQYSGWYLLYKFWPGGSGLRVVARLYLFLSFPVTALAVWYLSQKASTWRMAYLSIVCALLVLEEINGLNTARLDRNKETSHSLVAQRAPTQCRSFFSSESPDTDDRNPLFLLGTLYPHNVDAMLIAERVNLPTINGIASFNPPDWDFGYSTKPDYSLRVEKYAKSHNLAGLCRLDLTTMHWETEPKFVEAETGLGFWDFATDTISSDMIKGFGPIDHFGRWSIGHQAFFKYALAEAPDRAIRIRIALVTALVKGDHFQRVWISVNGERKQEFLLTNTADKNIDLTIASSSGNQGEIDFELPDAISPKDLGINADTRQLAIGVKSIEIR
jgi:hypothetical protein